LADCGSSSWRFYEDRTAHVAGLVLGDDDKFPTNIAVWQSSKNIYTPGANVKLVSKPFAGFKNNFGAGWIKKSASVRRVTLRRLETVLRHANGTRCVAGLPTRCTRKPSAKHVQGVIKNT